MVKKILMADLKPILASFPNILQENDRLRELTIEQFNRDLERSSEHYRIDNFTGASDLLNSLEKWIEEVVQKNPHRIQALCYLIDLEEEHSRSFFSDMRINTKDFALRMLFREFKKVYFRLQMES